MRHRQNGAVSRPSIDLPEQKARREQRLHSRYPVALELQYKLLDRRRVERLGVGRTVNISSGGVLFEAEGPLPGGPVELGINWPFLLDGVTKLKLIMSGQIVRTDAKTIAVKVEHHEFRTAGRSL
ncbi:MAG TPA: PilZ domain-containing protein [Terriglobales bacterium]|nr:PilZ domain-containing protein [Terriglobales bacterium]